MNLYFIIKECIKSYRIYQKNKENEDGERKEQIQSDINKILKEYPGDFDEYYLDQREEEKVNNELKNFSK